MQDIYISAGLPLVLEHELCHLYGGTHILEIPSVMNPTKISNNLDMINYNIIKILKTYPTILKASNINLRYMKDLTLVMEDILKEEEHIEQVHCILSQLYLEANLNEKAILQLDEFRNTIKDIFDFDRGTSVTYFHFLGFALNKKTLYCRMIAHNKNNRFNRGF